MSSPWGTAGAFSPQQGPDALVSGQFPLPLCPSPFLPILGPISQTRKQRCLSRTLRSPDSSSRWGLLSEQFYLLSGFAGQEARASVELGSAASVGLTLPIWLVGRLAGQSAGSSPG